MINFKFLTKTIRLKKSNKKQKIIFLKPYFVKKNDFCVSINVENKFANLCEFKILNIKGKVTHTFKGNEKVFIDNDQSIIYYENQYL